MILFAVSSETTSVKNKKTIFEIAVTWKETTPQWNFSHIFSKHHFKQTSKQTSLEIVDVLMFQQPLCKLQWLPAFSSIAFHSIRTRKLFSLGYELPELFITTRKIDVVDLQVCQILSRNYRSEQVGHFYLTSICETYLTISCHITHGEHYTLIQTSSFCTEYRKLLRGNIMSSSYSIVEFYIFQKINFRTNV